MSEPCSSNLPIELLARLYRSLNHELRNPLSVISNELYILQAEGHRVDAALDAVRRVDSVLQLCQGFVPDGEPAREVKAEALLLELGFAMEVGYFGDISWHLPVNKFSYALREFFRLLEEIGLLKEMTAFAEGKRLGLKLAKEIQVGEKGVRLLPSQLFHGTHESNHPALPFLDALFVESGVYLACFQSTNLVLYQE